MIRPFTCVCLILAAGSGLYLYQVKQRAFALDAALRGTFHDIDVARDRTRMLRADWALVNDPERLQALASQYLQLQPMAPSQLMTMDQLAAALPPPLAPGSAPTAAPDAGALAPAPAKPGPAIDPTQGMPMAEAAPPVPPLTPPALPDVALLQPVAPASVAAPAALAAPDPAAPGIAVPAATAASPVRHRVRHAAPAAQTQPWLAEANAGSVGKPRRAHRHAAPDAPPAQFYAANEPARQLDPAPRITPPVATVMYSPAAGSSLGMAASAAMAPPRPLYSTSQ